MEYIALATAFFQLARTVIEKVLPEKQTPTLRKMAQKVVNPTIEMLARAEERRQARLKRGRK